MTNEDYNVQGSEAWVKFRAQHIGASEVASVLGVSPWVSKHDLYLLKTGQKEPQRSNAAMQRGSLYEPAIRKLYEKQTGINAEPMVLEHPEHKFISASLDGFCHQRNWVSEFKYPSKDTHQKALKGIVPEHYKIQIQTQLACSMADGAHFVTYDGETDSIAIVEVLRDDALIARIIKECTEFWNCVQTRTPPPSDITELQDADLEQLLEDYVLMTAEAKRCQEQADELKKRIEPQIISDKTRVGNYMVSWISRKGSVNYKAIPELKNVDLDQYRAKDSKYISIKLGSEND